jgi:hypothetical protein
MICDAESSSKQPSVGSFSIETEASEPNGLLDSSQGLPGLSAVAGRPRSRPPWNYRCRACCVDVHPVSTEDPPARPSRDLSNCVVPASSSTYAVTHRSPGVAAHLGRPNRRAEDHGEHMREVGEIKLTTNKRHHRGSGHAGPIRDGYAALASLARYIAASACASSRSASSASCG